MSGEMGRFSFGVEIHPFYDAETLMSEIEVAEQLGYDHVWLGDSQLIWRELYVLLGAAAQATTRVLLGTGVTNPITRLPAVTASAIVTLQELSGGRVILGVGTGDSSVRTMGMKPSTVAELEQFVAQVRELCRGEAVRRSTGEMRLTFGSDDKCPRVVVGAAGPRMLNLAGRIADGVILGGGANREAVVKKMLQCVAEGRRQSTRSGDRFEVFASLPACVDSDREKALSAVRPHVARSLLTPQWELSAAAAAVRDKIRPMYDYYEHMNPTAQHAELIPDEVVPEFAIAGTASECIEQASQLFEWGADQITIRPYAVPGTPRVAAIQAFAEYVMKPLRGKA
ncbi:MAG: LLM class flavin-dependent oxidoreductase [Acidobacteriota bacterium]